MVTKKYTSRTSSSKSKRTSKSKSTPKETPPLSEAIVAEEISTLDEALLASAEDQQLATNPEPSAPADEVEPTTDESPELTDVEAELLEVLGEGKIMPEHVIGSFDACNFNRVGGWAVNTSATDEPLLLEVWADGQPVVFTVANLFRQDLLQNGIGTGNNGYDVKLPVSLADGLEHVIEVREASSQVVLPGSPKIFQCEASGALLAEGWPEEVVVPEQPAAPLDKSKILFDEVVGFMAYGWSYADQAEQPAIRVIYGNNTLGKFKTQVQRTDVMEVLGIETSRVGYKLMLGGILQFSALARQLSQVKFKQNCLNGQAVDVDLSRFYEEAFTFAPLKSLSRPFEFPSLGAIKSARCSNNAQFSLLLEVGDATINASKQVQFDFYQQDKAGNIITVGHFDVELAGQLSNLEFDLISIEQPILWVITDAQRNILLTDCVPCPDLFLPRYEPLIEYHSLLANGQPSFDVAAKIGRGYLDFKLGQAVDGTAELNPGQANRNNTAVVLFVRDTFDAFTGFDSQYYQHLSDTVVFLDRDGIIHKADGSAAYPTIQAFIADSGVEFYLLCELNNAIRPDFWSIFEGQRDRLNPVPALIYWDSIWLEGASRPYWVKNDLLCHEIFSKHSLSPINALIVTGQLLLESLALNPSSYRSGSLRPENAFNFAGIDKVLRIPVVMDIYRLQLIPQVTKRFMEAHNPLADFKVLAANDFTGQLSTNSLTADVGVSIIINYRNSADVTIRCLQSIRLQRFSGPIELILVNNGSTPGQVRSVTETAIRLFDEANVKLIDYNERFNHSAQCNVAAQVASHDYLMMLSNDSILISPDALAQSVEIASIPWVGTCGYRIVGSNNERTVLRSFGLRLSDTQYLFSGGSPLSTNNKPPMFMLDYTIASVGNTFAAVMIKKSVYEAMGGLDELFFPTDYNDVDFCLRALGQHYRHIVIGNALIGHTGRGSREMNLDLPINQKIIERLPLLSELINNFGIQSL